MSGASFDVPASALDRARSWLAQPFVASFIGGGIAGVTSRTVVSPLERAKVLIQVGSVGRDDYRLSLPRVLYKMLSEEGLVRGFLSGNLSNCIRILPYSAVQFASHSLYQETVENYTASPLTTTQRLCCGALAGMTSVLFTYPLDIARTRLSIQSSSFEGLKANAGHKLPGLWGVMKDMYKQEGGWKAFTRGLGPTIFGVAPYVSLNFTLYSYARSYLTAEGQSTPSSAGKLAAGAIAGGLAQTCTYPLDVLRRKFQVGTMAGIGKRYNSVWDAVSTIVKEDGFRGLYRGLAINIWKVVPAMSVSFWTFEAVRDYLVDLKPIQPRDAD